MDLATSYALGTQAAADQINDRRDALEAAAERGRVADAARAAERREPRRIIRWTVDPTDPWGGTPIYAPGMEPAE